MQALGIILLSVLSAVLYGIVHDQVTARICIEYFTIGHAPLIQSDSPTVLGLFWGVVATWWVGLPLGTGLAIAARVGKRPKLTCTQLIRPLAILLACMYVVAGTAGLTGYLTAREDMIHLLDPMASRIPADKHVAFLTAAWAHLGSYLSGILGGIILWILTWRRRRLLITLTNPEPEKS
ncbi:hypothetical protein Rhal01_02548 [Rubritalea halochordaticola]|uniref:Uncharacterized protein n=1 Tax=Rubritalea halochordaticola TaxID=714537 RepID=A0ABP9V173_9BACT